MTVLNSSPIIAFVATTAPSRAKTFYTKTLGLKLVSEDDFALIFDAARGIVCSLQTSDHACDLLA